MEASLVEISSKQDDVGLVTASMPKVSVLGGRITPLNLSGTVSLLLEMVRHKKLGYVCIANTHTTTLALRDEQFKQAIDGATAVVADGVPVLWQVRAAGHSEIGRVHGVDLVEATCKAGLEHGLRHGFFGGWNSVAEEMIFRLRRRYPTLEVAGIWNPGVIRVGQAAPEHLIDAINASRCDVLWIGLGAPKQEIWMEQQRPQLNVPALVAVGQAFDIIAGRNSRAPDWMGRHGLEWLYRLSNDPVRLWRRYLVYNSLFLWYLLRERTGYKLGRSNWE
jgi:N-acetylglucosaminyldiphosphoundecaprenol N-acetyl-beta-D-mannosaminyltransferase